MTRHDSRLLRAGGEITLLGGHFGVLIILAVLVTEPVVLMLVVSFLAPIFVPALAGLVMTFRAGRRAIRTQSRMWPHRLGTLLLVPGLLYSVHLAADHIAGHTVGPTASITVAAHITVVAGVLGAVSAVVGLILCEIGVRRLPHLVLPPVVHNRTRILSALLNAEIVVTLVYAMSPRLVAGGYEPTLFDRLASLVWLLGYATVIAAAVILARSWGRATASRGRRARGVLLTAGLLHGVVVVWVLARTGPGHDLDVSGPMRFLLVGMFLTVGWQLIDEVAPRRDSPVGLLALVVLLVLSANATVITDRSTDVPERQPGKASAKDFSNSGVAGPLRPQTFTTPSVAVTR